jgi:hypothetical protein
MYRNLYSATVSSFLFLVLLAASSFAATKEDTCAAEGMIVKNMTMLDLWYERNGGKCTIWIHDHILMIKPDDTVDIFSDLTCETLYCEDNSAYEDYKSTDQDRDCGVKILPDCTLSDM